jgi:hypothetical protein
LAYASPPPRADSHVGAVSQPRTRPHSPSSTLGISMLNGVASGYRISRRSLLCCSSFENLRWI